MRSTWEDRRKKDKRKVKHLQKKWGRKGEEVRRGEEDLLAGIRCGDEELRSRAEEQRREVVEVERPRVYGGIQPTPLAQESKLQGDGGPIGLKLSGAIAKVFMVWWCRNFRHTLVGATRHLPSFMLHLYKLYVDDQGLVVEELPPGARYLEGEVRVVEEEVEGDLLLPGDQMTAELLQTIANTICPHTTMEVDYPSAHSSGYMPILDIKIKVRDDKTIDWRFYKKPVSSKQFILSRSAVPGKVKRASLAQEGLRRLRNTRPDMVEEDKVMLLEDMGEGMMVSGYPQAYRESILRSALTGYRKQVEASHRGLKPLYRPRGWGVEERRRRKRLKQSWYRPADTVLFLPSTPGSELATKARRVVEEECGRLGLTARVVERAGTTMRQIAAETDLGGCRNTRVHGSGHTQQQG